MERLFLSAISKACSNEIFCAKSGIWNNKTMSVAIDFLDILIFLKLIFSN